MPHGQSSNKKANNETNLYLALLFMAGFFLFVIPAQAGIQIFSPVIYLWVACPT
jgi:hypothetical protein